MERVGMHFYRVTINKSNTISFQKRLYKDLLIMVRTDLALVPKTEKFMPSWRQQLGHDDPGCVSLSSGLIKKSTTLLFFDRFLSSVTQIFAFFHKSLFAGDKETQKPGRNVTAGKPGKKARLCSMIKKLELISKLDVSKNQFTIKKLMNNEILGTMSCQIKPSPLVGTFDSFQILFIL